MYTPLQVHNVEVLGYGKGRKSLTGSPRMMVPSHLSVPSPHYQLHLATLRLSQLRHPDRATMIPTPCLYLDQTLACTTALPIALITSLNCNATKYLTKPAMNNHKVGLPQIAPPKPPVPPAPPPKTLTTISFTEIYHFPRAACHSACHHQAAPAPHQHMGCKPLDTHTKRYTTPANPGRPLQKQLPPRSCPSMVAMCCLTAKLLHPRSSIVDISADCIAP